MYQTLKTVFDHFSKHLIVRQKYSTARRISVFGNVVKHGLSCLIYYITPRNHIIPSVFQSV